MGNSNNHMSENAREQADSHMSKWHGLADQRWTYGRERGPTNWWVYFPQANGHHQSPVDISPEEAEFDSDFKTYPLSVNYLQEETRVLSNTGHAWQVDIKKSQSYVTGGPVQSDKYYLQQFHMHWGDKDQCGSEHTIHGSAFSGELHFVHYNSKYKDFKTAMNNPDGLLVLAVFLKLNRSYSASGIDTIQSQVDRISYKGDTTELSGLDIASLFPRDISKYWMYKGSLTTPPCLESVTWIVFYEPILTNSRQLSSFRQLKSHHCSDLDTLSKDEFGGRIIKNFRPIQQLGGRTISTTEHTFMGYPEFDEQFHKHHLFTTYDEFNCQFSRQGLQ